MAFKSKKYKYTEKNMLKLDIFKFAHLQKIEQPLIFMAVSF